MADDEYVTLAEVRDLLAAENDKRELRNSQKAALMHAQTVSSLSVDDAEALVGEIKAMDFMSKVNETVAYKIADMMPRYPVEVRAIFSKEHYTPDEGEIKQVIEACDRYRRDNRPVLSIGCA